MRVRDLETVVSHGLCTGCGLCESMAGRASIEMGLTAYGQMRPTVKRRLEPGLLDRILRACPGVTLQGPSPKGPLGEGSARGRFDRVWGPMLSLAKSWAGDPAIRHKAAAGGTLTALGCFLLDSGRVQAVLHVRASAAKPLLTDAQVSTTSAEVVAGSQSRYGPAAPLVHVMRLLDEGRVFAVIAKPCDISAIRNLGRQDPRVARQIPYCLTIFCGGVPTVQTAEKIVRYHGVSPDEVAVFRWRGEGWPGPTHVETRDGRSYDLSYDETWYAPGMPWTYDIQFRCKICPDAIGEAADVSAPDGWVMENGRPIHREAPGANLAIARTERGRELLEAAAASGHLVLAPFADSEFRAMHRDHLPRKLGQPGRSLGLLLTGQPRPRVRGYRPLAALRGAGLVASLRAFFGMVRRVRAGANREPPR